MAARLCSKTACGRPAAASCAYVYSDRLVWIEDLRPERDPSFYDLCDQHADSLRVMQGWRLEDHRPRSATQVALLLP